MHITYLTNEFVTETKPFAGLATYLDNITTIMKNKGHKVSIIILSEEHREFYYKNAIRVICVKAKKSNAPLSDLERTMIALKNCWQIYCELKKLNSLRETEGIELVPSKSKGIKLSFEKEGVFVDISVIAHYGYNVPEIAYGIQQTIKQMVESMTKYKIAKVDVHVQSVVFPEAKPVIPENPDESTQSEDGEEKDN